MKQESENSASEEEVEFPGAGNSGGSLWRSILKFLVTILAGALLGLGSFYVVKTLGY